MSPRRKLDADSRRFGEEPVLAVKHDRWGWVRGLRGLPGLGVVATVVVAVAIGLTGRMLWSHEKDENANAKDAAVLGYVGQFMADYTTLDPFHANAYGDRILKDATGDFAKEFKDKENEILVRVARAEPSKGTVLEAGIERWHDDGSASVLVATKMTTTVGNPPKPVDNGNRWVVTAVKEGQQWKISQLTQVI
ncbi:MAG TPA: mammalian cell entry protein [Mycobacterium sp.]|nr:mammalian cell entry protein [Mycobacterium sp.]